MFNSKLALAAISAAQVMAHGAGLNLRTASNEVPYPPPAAISYHLHIVFNLDDPTSLPAALALRDEARAHFADLLGEDCDGRYDNARLCLIYDHDVSKAVFGPFFSGEWSIFVPVAYVNTVLFWFTQRYMDVPTASVLLHPNTGYEYEDHSEWALWGGGAQAINMAIFEQGVMTNEFD